MELQEIVNLIHLRRFLHDVQNGYSAISKEQLRGINSKLKELDITIVKNALEANLTRKTVVEYASSESDYEASNNLVLEARKRAKATADFNAAPGGVTVANAPADPSEPVDPATQMQKVAEPVQAAPKKRKGAFSRTEE